MAKDFFSGLLGGDGGNPMAGFNEVIQPTKLPEGAPYDLQSYQAARSALLGKIGASLLAAGQPLTGDQRAQYLSQLGDASGAYNEALKGGVDQRLKVAQLEQHKIQTDQIKQALELRRRAQEELLRRSKLPAVPAAPTTIAPTPLSPEAPVAPPAPPVPPALAPIPGAVGGGPLPSGGFAPPVAPGPAPGPGPGPAIAPPVAPPVAPAPGAIAPRRPGLSDEHKLRLVAAGMSLDDVEKMDIQEQMKHEDAWVPIAANDPYRAANGYPSTVPLHRKVDASGNTLDVKAGTDYAEEARKDAQRRADEAAKEKTIAERHRGDEQYKVEKDLRTEYGAATKDFAARQTSFKTMENLAQEKTGASDLDLVIEMYKVFDPTSTVTSNEAATAAKSGGPIANIIGAFNSLQGGGTLAPEIRQSLLEATRKRYDQELDLVSHHMDRYGGLAKEHGIDPKRVVDEDIRDKDLLAERPDRRAASVLTPGRIGVMTAEEMSGITPGVVKRLSAEQTAALIARRRSLSGAPAEASAEKPFWKW